MLCSPSQMLVLLLVFSDCPYPTHRVVLHLFLQTFTKLFPTNWIPCPSQAWIFSCFHSFILFLHPCIWRLVNVPCLILRLLYATTDKLNLSAFWSHWSLTGSFMFWRSLTTTAFKGFVFYCSSFCISTSPIFFSFVPNWFPLISWYNCPPPRGSILTPLQSSQYTKS